MEANKIEANSKEITLNIDGKEVKAKEGSTILDVAKSIGVNIPTLCHIKVLSPFCSCRVCSVEIVDKKGRNRLVTSCNYPVEEGLVVYTASEKTLNTRKLLLELLLARCPKAPKIKELALEYGIQQSRFLSEDENEDCILCGLCTRVCDELIGVQAINFTKRGVEREVTTPYHEFSNECIGCGACVVVCPTKSKRLHLTTYPTLEEDKLRIAARFLKGTRDEDNGVYIEMLSGKSNIDGQDGGMATSLLLSGLEKGLFDAAIVVKRTDGYNSEAVVVENIEDIIQAKGTKYLRVKMMALVADLITKGKRRLAMVGTACEIRSARQIQELLLPKFPDLDLTLVGLFCFEAFDYEKLKSETKRLLSVDLDRADKTQIKKGKFIVITEGKEYSCSVKDLDKAVENGCVYCDDFTSTLADISVGSIGSNDGYSTVIVRSERGNKLLEKLNFAKAEVRKEEITRLSILKKNRAKKYFAPMMQPQPKPDLQFSQDVIKT